MQTLRSPKEGALKSMYYSPEGTFKVEPMCITVCCAEIVAKGGALCLEHVHPASC